MDFQTVIIGAGVVGLATARSFARNSTNLCVIEKEATYGMGTSSRNSEVIHSGIYYPLGSLKSKLCISGNALTYEYCENYKVDYNKCGKMIIAIDDDDLKKLSKLEDNAKALGIDYKVLNEDQIRKLEPLVRAKSALHIQTTGVIDSHAFMKSLYEEIIQLEAAVAFKTEVIEINKIKKGYQIKIKNPDQSLSKITTSTVVNCAGLNSWDICKIAKINNDKYKLQFSKGSYFWINNKIFSEISCLIYPTPNKQLNGLGIHLTKGLDGRIRLGPDNEYIGEDLSLDYSINTSKKLEFYNSCKKYLPDLGIGDLEPDFSGIRPKLQKPTEKFRDFVISNEVSLGYKNFINMVGIESPGLTSSIAIGNYALGLLKK